MTKTPEQMKNMVTEWCDEIKEPYNVMTQAEKQKLPIEFGIIIGQQNNKIVSYVPTAIKSRLIFNMQINFAEIHKKITSEMKKENFNEFMLMLSDKMTLYDVNWTFSAQGQQINNIVMTKFIDESELNRGTFHHVLDRCKLLKMQIIRIIGITLGGTTTVTTESGSGSTPGVI